MGIMQNISRATINRLSSRLLVSAWGINAGTVVSVLILTRNRSSYLSLTIAALERQTLDRNHWEVIVLDNASHDDTHTCPN